MEASGSKPQIGENLTPPAQERRREYSSLGRFVVVTSVAVGALVGLAEVSWVYLLPSFNEQWRAVLPTSVWGISRFAAVAVVIDALLALAGGGALLIFLTLLGRLVRALDHPERARLLSRTIILGTAGSYLYTGWMGLYVLLSQDRRSLTYLIILAVGAVLSFGIAFAVSAALGAMERRDWRRAPRVAWCAAAVILLLVTAHGRTSYWLPLIR